MAWIELHEELLNHPKTAVLGEAMGWNKFESAGRLYAFWTWAMKYAPTGSLKDLNDAVLGVAVELNGEAATVFVRAMISARWLDRREGGLRIHDWPDYAARYLRDTKFKKRPDKWQEVLAVYSDRSVSVLEKAQNSDGVSRGTNQPTNQTHPPTPRARQGVGEGMTKKQRAEQMLAEEIANEQRTALPRTVALAAAGGAVGE